MSDFVTVSFKHEENMNPPPFQELVDDIVESIVNSFRKMLSEYHLLEEAKQNASQDEKNNLLSAEARKMEVLRVMLRIITNAFEAIFQRIQCYQFKMNGELTGS